MTVAFQLKLVQHQVTSESSMFGSVLRCIYLAMFQLMWCYVMLLCYYIASYLKFNICMLDQELIDLTIYSQSCKNTNHDHKVEIVEIVTKYKYLDTVFDNKLGWDDNTGIIVKKCQQHQYFLENKTLCFIKPFQIYFYNLFLQCYLFFIYLVVFQPEC